MKDLFLLDKKIAEKKDKLAQLKKLKTILIKQVEFDEKRKADELVN